MRTLILSVITLTMSLVSEAQGQTAREKIEAAKIALVTERLELSPDQAEKFWPIYNEFHNRQREIASEFRQARANYNPEKATEEESKKLLQMGLQVKERQVEMEKIYSERLLKIISSRQLMNLRKAEDDFRQMLMQRVRQRNQNRQRNNNQRELRDLRNQQKNKN